MPETDDAEIRAAVVYAQIEELVAQLSDASAVAAFLRVQLGVREALIADLDKRIQALHVKRNAIFHEED